MKNSSVSKWVRKALFGGAVAGIAMTTMGTTSALAEGAGASGEGYGYAYAYAYGRDDSRPLPHSIV